MAMWNGPNASEINISTHMNNRLNIALAFALMLWASTCSSELSDQEKIDASLCTDTAFAVLTSPFGGADKAMAGLTDCLTAHGLAAPDEATAKLFRSFKEFSRKYPPSTLTIPKVKS